MTSKELVIEALRKLGYEPKVDDDGDIFIRYQLKTILFLVSKDNDKHVSILLPQFFDVEGEDMLAVLMICSKLSRELKILKVFMGQELEGVTASWEFCYSDSEHLEENIVRALRVLGVIRSLFRKEYLDMLNAD